MGSVPRTAISANKERRREMAPNSLANLKPFQPGVSGNPTGRPANKLAEAIRSQTKEGLEIAEYMVGVFKGTIEPDRNKVAAATWLADYGFPKPDSGAENTGLVAQTLVNILVTMPPEFIVDLNRKLIAASGDPIDVQAHTVPGLRESVESEADAKA